MGAEMQQLTDRHRIRGPVLGPLTLALFVLMFGCLIGLYRLVKDEDQAKVAATMQRV